MDVTVLPLKRAHNDIISNESDESIEDDTVQEPKRQKIEGQTRVGAYNKVFPVHKTALVCQDEDCTNHDHDHQFFENWLYEQMQMIYQMLCLDDFKRKYPKMDAELWSLMQEKQKCIIWQDGKRRAKCQLIFHDETAITTHMMLLQLNWSTMPNNCRPSKICDTVGCLLHWIPVTKNAIDGVKFSSWMTKYDQIHYRAKIFQGCWQMRSSGCIIYNTVNARGYAIEIKLWHWSWNRHRAMAILKQDGIFEPSQVACHDHKYPTNCVFHVRMDSESENSLDKFRHGSLVRLRDDIVEQIILSKGTSSQSKRAKKFNITPGLVNAIDQGTCYKDVRQKVEAKYPEIPKVVEKEKIVDLLELFASDRFKSAAQSIFEKQTTAFTDENGTCHMVATGVTAANFHGEAVRICGRIMQIHQIRFAFHHPELYANKSTKQMVLHECRVRGCTSIEHLKLGDSKQNGQDRIRDRTVRYALTDDQVKLIYKTKVANPSWGATRIARELQFGTKRIVLEILKGRTYQHVTHSQTLDTSGIQIKYTPKEVIIMRVLRQERPEFTVKQILECIGRGSTDSINKILVGKYYTQLPGPIIRSLQSDEFKGIKRNRIYTDKEVIIIRILCYERRDLSYEQILQIVGKGTINAINHIAQGKTYSSILNNSVYFKSKKKLRT